MFRDVKKWMLYMVLCFVFCVVLGRGTQASEMGMGDDVEYLPDDFFEAEESDDGQIEIDGGAELRILFVGNSLVGKNSMGEIFEQMAAAGGHDIQVETLWKSGCSLSQYASRNHPMGKRLRNLLKKMEWDYVILQDRTVRPVTGEAASKRAVKKLRKLIKKNGAKMRFLETWAPEKKHKTYRKPRFRGMSEREFQRQVRSFYLSLGRKYRTKVLMVGDVFEAARDMKGIKLFVPDGKHPSIEGSYLAASVCYLSFFEEKIPVWDGPLKAQKAEKLRDIAVTTAIK